MENKNPLPPEEKLIKAIGERNVEMLKVCDAISKLALFADDLREIYAA